MTTATLRSPRSLRPHTMLTVPQSNSTLLPMRYGPAPSTTMPRPSGGTDMSSEPPPYVTYR